MDVRVLKEGLEVNLRFLLLSIGPKDCHDFGGKVKHDKMKQRKLGKKKESIIQNGTYSLNLIKGGDDILQKEILENFPVKIINTVK